MSNCPLLIHNQTSYCIQIKWVRSNRTYTKNMEPLHSTQIRYNLNELITFTVKYQPSYCGLSCINWICPFLCLSSSPDCTDQYELNNGVISYIPQTRIMNLRLSVRNAQLKLESEPNEPVMIASIGSV